MAASPPLTVVTPAPPSEGTFADRLLGWYDVHGRTLPWRSRSGPGDPYTVWVSEIMLQQTTVATVTPYFQRFMDRWPTLSDLARASLDDVLHMWQGLGYYTRARSLHQCARVVQDTWGGRFPGDENDLLKLPGIGPYTAAALTTICFEGRASAVDGNIVRVLSRHTGLATQGPLLTKQVKEEGYRLLPPNRRGDYTQALMDLGALVCTPRNPSCFQCPLRTTCYGFGTGTPEAFPVKKAKDPLCTKYGDAFWIQDEKGRFFLQQETENRLLAGLMRPPLSPFRDIEDVPVLFPLDGTWQPVDGTIRHTFTHFKLSMTSWILQPNFPLSVCPPLASGVWVAVQDFPTQAFSTLVRKLIAKLTHKIDKKDCP